MPVSVSDALPDVTLKYFTASGSLSQISMSELTKGKKVVIVGVPGAFTPTCSKNHVPGFLDKAADFKSKGIDTIAVVSVNDVFVMESWKKDLGAGDGFLFLADGNAEFAQALGFTVDLSGFGMGVRCRRFAMLVEDSQVKVLNLEDGGAFTCSGADSLLSNLV